jgi:hypothetical protein
MFACMRLSIKSSLAHSTCTVASFLRGRLLHGMCSWWSFQRHGLQWGCWSCHVKSAKDFISICVHTVCAFLQAWWPCECSGTYFTREISLGGASPGGFPLEGFSVCWFMYWVLCACTALCPQGQQWSSCHLEESKSIEVSLCTSCVDMF